MGEECTEKEWDKIKDKLFKDGFDIMLAGNEDLVNSLLPNRAKIVFHDGGWWLRIKGEKVD